MANASTANRPVTAPMHLCVCICTYRRPQPLERLLRALAGQDLDGTFTFSLVVADNDAARSASAVVEAFASRVPIPVVYCVEPRRSIALARNRAVEFATGDYVAWIDDDEFPARDWLRHLLRVADRGRVAAVVGPVRPHFDAPPPRWLVKGRFCERGEFATGTVMPWHRCFAGNALIRREILAAMHPPFRVEFGLGGEDVDMFRRVIAVGHRVLWCNEAVVHEVVPPCRWTRRYYLERALVHGACSLHLTRGSDLLKSALAIPAYSLVLPFTPMLGQHVCVKYSGKLLGHVGRLLAACGIQPIAQRPL